MRRALRRPWAVAALALLAVPALLPLVSAAVAWTVGAALGTGSHEAAEPP